MTKLTAVCLLSALLVACGESADGPPADTRAQDQQIIDSLYQVWIAAALAGDAAGYAAFFADSGALLPPNAAAVVGRSAVAAWAERFFAQYSIDGGLTSSSGVQVSGDLAYHQFTTAGHYVPKDGTQPVAFDQKYIDVLRREPDGWKLLYHMWSPNTSAPGVWR